MKHLYIIEATSLHDTLVTCAHIYGRKEAEEEKNCFKIAATICMITE